MEQETAECESSLLAGGLVWSWQCWKESKFLTCFAYFLLHCVYC